jgi:hypothetical protein
MSRAVVEYKTKDELKAMSQASLNEYILKLKQKAAHLGTSPRKSVLKQVEVAEKIYRNANPHEAT